MATASAVSNFIDKRVTIIGLAREGVALARFLAQAGARVTISDLKSEEQLRSNVAALADLGIKFVLGGHPEEILDTDIVFLSPGVPLDAPIVLAARQRHLPISTETRLFLELCPAPVIGITGSSGKTTTVTLTGEILRRERRATFVGGNIGQPLIGYLDQIKPGDAVVMELSSFQLDLFRNWPSDTIGIERFLYLSKGKSPHIAAILNITPNHLDRHRTMEEYIDAKRQILRYQTKQDYAVLGLDDAVASALRPEAIGHLLTFSQRHEVEEGAFVREGIIVIRIGHLEAPICHISELRLLGRHNVSNVLAACAIAAAAGASAESMAAVATTFQGVEHRLEFVRELDGVRYYNDSIATSPERAVAALEAFDRPIVLLAGGRDKHLPWDRWARVVAQKVRSLILFGEAASLIEEAARATWQGDKVTTLPILRRCKSMEEAVEAAAELAQPGDIVLLAPGGTSFDAYRDFAERGSRFKEVVLRMKGRER